MMTNECDINVAWISDDVRFIAIKRRKAKFMIGCGLFMMAYFFSMPIGAAYYPSFFRVRIWGNINFGLLFSFSQYLMAWFIMFIYMRFMRGIDIQVEAITFDMRTGLGETK